MILTGKYLCVASLEDIRLQNRALLDGPVFPVRVNGASVLKGKGSRAVTVQSPGVPEQRSVGMEKSGWGSLVVCAVVVKVPTQSSHLKLWNCCANSFSNPVCPLWAKSDRHSVSSIPGHNETKISHLGIGGGLDFTSIATE